MPPKDSTATTTTNNTPSSLATNNDNNADKPHRRHSSSTPEPFTDPNPHTDSTRQKIAQIVALPLAAAGGVVLEVAQKVKEIVTGDSTKIDTKHDHPHHHQTKNNNEA